jgi:phosphoribosyl-ATP pyrophosphohydrolase
VEHPLARLQKAIEARRDGNPATSRTARLMTGGRTKMAKKLCEEATEVAFEAVKGHRAEVVQESADLLYHLAIVWSAVGVTPAEVWAELERRERLLGIAEKPPKPRVR